MTVTLEKQFTVYTKRFVVFCYVFCLQIDVAIALECLCVELTPSFYSSVTSQVCTGKLGV